MMKLTKKSKTILIINLDEINWGILPTKSLAFLHLSLYSEEPFQNFYLDDIQLNESQHQRVVTEIEKYTWDRFLNYLSLRDHSIFECRTYLKGLFLHYSIIEKFIEKALGYNYLNEARFTELYVESLLDKGKSEIEIRNKLREKRVSSDLIDDTLSQLNTPDKKEAVLMENLHKAIRRFSRFPKEEKKKKIINYLYRKGFSYFEVKTKLEMELEDD